MTARSVLVALLLISAFSCKKKDKQETETQCTIDCKNGGVCVDNACNCPDEWRGAECDIYYTYMYAGTYISKDFQCGNSGAVSKTVVVSVDPNNRYRLYFDGMHGDLSGKSIDIPYQSGSKQIHGAGTLDGTILTMTYTSGSNLYTLTTTCRGTFTKQ